MNDEDSEKLNNRRIVDQSALMQNIIKILHNKSEDISYKNIQTGPLVVGLSDSEESPEKDVGLVVNKLYNFKQFINSYSKLTSADLSNLLPYIQISKIYEDDSEFLFPFNNFFPRAAIDSITSAGSDRGYQANLVNVEFISQGKDTATTFIYQVKLNIIFDSVQTLFNDNSRYVELFNPPKKSGRFKRGDFDPKYYRIKLKFGWNTNLTLPSNLKPQELKVFADLSGSEIFLNYVMHKLTINEDGSVALQVEYIGSLEMLSRNPDKFNLLSSEKIEELDKIGERIETIKENLSESYNVLPDYDDKGSIKSVKLINKADGSEASRTTDQTELERLYRELQEKESNGREEFINGIIKKIIEQYDGFLPTLKIDHELYKKRKQIIEKYSSYSDVEQIERKNDIIKAERQPKAVILDRAKPEDNKDPQGYFLSEEFNEKDKLLYKIPFFTFGALLKALDSLGSKEKESEFIVIAGDCKLASFGDFLTAKEIQSNPDYKIYVDNGLKIDDELVVWQNEIQVCNILDIPISLSTFRYWMVKNVTSQNLSKISLINFLNLCCNNLLNLAVKCSNEDYIPKQNLNFKLLFDQVEINNDNSFLNLIRSRQGPNRILNKSDYVDMSLMDKQLQTSKKIKKNIIVFYAIPLYVSRKSNLKQDINDGIPHFYYGANKGIINKITFREESMPFVREANIQTQVDRKPWKAGVFLRGKYNVLIEMLGTVNFRIGTLIYVSPSFPGVINFGEPIEYGIGGYFLIVSIKTSIESGKYITSLEANWVSTGTGEITSLSHLPITVKRLSAPYDQRKEETKQKQEAEANREPTPRAIRRGTI